MTYNRVIVEKKIRSYIEEDCSYKDISSSLIPENSQVSAKIIAKSDGYISGLEELKILWELLKVTSKFRKKDTSYDKHSWEYCPSPRIAHRGEGGEIY